MIKRTRKKITSKLEYVAQGSLVSIADTIAIIPQKPLKYQLDEEWLDVFAISLDTGSVYTKGEIECEIIGDSILEYTKK